MRILEAQKHTDPDPNPEHWRQVFLGNGHSHPTVSSKITLPSPQAVNGEAVKVEVEEKEKQEEGGGGGVRGRSPAKEIRGRSPQKEITNLSPSKSESSIVSAFFFKIIISIFKGRGAC